jgi:hemolysin activation/secretion protein
LKLGRPLGNFTRLSLEYDVLSAHYGDTDNTGDTFVLPSDNLTHSVELGASFSRAGYGLSARGSYSRRSEWDFWGLPGNPDWTEEKQDFLRWQARASKNWYLPRFQKIGAEIDYAGGSDLDRFSKYQFGFFGGTRVHGYQSNRVRAEEAWAAHMTYGFEVGELLRLDAVGDVAWATDEATGLDRELLGGVGLAGTFIGPWQTVVNLDVGVPVAGPDDGFVLYVVFLKLFK